MYPKMLRIASPNKESRHDISINKAPVFLKGAFGCFTRIKKENPNNINVRSLKISMKAPNFGIAVTIPIIAITK
jgi:hypothetical protein